ncbi:hypothetical protein NDU88_012048 [Pleurodeles waltl]|uniref:Uncharacterized protein n=1 Tax=Pleurodeles waltl TaxID=8319 RepID=A0AAV7S2Z3_PLEWA|nr:hypothetical protein NDU88_012048 [Pleurodeles waltl]
MPLPVMDLHSPRVTVRLGCLEVDVLSAPELGLNFQVLGVVLGPHSMPAGFSEMIVRQSNSPVQPLSLHDIHV